jgi:hypothetical protein
MLHDMHPIFRLLLWSLLLGLGIALPFEANAQPKDRYTISLITMSPGDPIFFRFGHNAILVHDSLTRTHRVYNWGTFSFDEPGLVQKFLRGRLTYWLSAQGLAPTLHHYDSENRWIVEQELDLTREQKLRIVRLIEENARPENRQYRYHYYKDNCSTRVRDILDEVLEGKLKAVSTSPSSLTFRGQTSRLVADVWWGHFFLNLAMGSFIDQPITEWEEMFVPEKVQQMVRKVQNTDASGRMVPLVKEEKTLVQAPGRKPPPDTPPTRWPQFLLVGAILGAGFGWAGLRLLKHPKKNGKKTPVGKRLLLGLPLFTLTTLTGFLGLIFLFFWTLTDHEVAYHNENLMQMGPWTAAFPIIAVGLMRDRPWAKSSFRWLAYATAALSFLGLLLKALPFFDQVNVPIIAMMLPIWLGVAAGPFFATRAKRHANSTATEP